MANLQACFAANSGIESIQAVFIATRFAITLHGVLWLNPRWLSQANEVYARSIHPAKPQQESILQDVTAENPGILLHHHAPLDYVPTGYGRSCTYAKAVSFDKLTEWEVNTLLREQTIVNGPSGTTNLMAHLGMQVAATDPGFKEADHHLNTLMFVVFDGGHSTEEVLYTLHLIKELRRGEAHVSFAGGYAAIAELGGTAADRQALKERLDQALERTIDYFATHVA